MNSIATNTAPASDDIDLLALVERTIVFFRKFKWIFIVGIAAGLTTGWLICRKLPRVYQSRMILHSFTLSNEDYIQVVDNFNNLLKSDEHEQLARQFDISPAVLAKVRQIKGIQIQRVFTANNPNGFYIDVFVTDNSILGELQKGILNGLENIDYIHRQIAVKKANLLLLIAEVEKEIGQLDSTKANVARLLAGKIGYTSSLMIDVSGMNRQLVDLNEKLLNYKQDLQFTTAVQVLQGFSAFNHPAGPHLAVWLGLGFLGGAIFAYLLSLYLSINNKLRLRRR